MRQDAKGKKEAKRKKEAKGNERASGGWGVGGREIGKDGRKEDRGKKNKRRNKSTFLRHRFMH